MKILEEARAPNPRRVRIFLAEKGIEMAYEPVPIMEKAHKQPEFSALNPVQRVPVLVLDDGTAISESQAICRYFEETHPNPPLLGDTALEKAQIEMWNRRLELRLLMSIAHCFRHLHPAMAELEVPQVAEWGEANRGRALEMLEILDDALGRTAYVAGEKYTVADITGLVAIDFMKPARIERPAGLKNIGRWYEEVSARPSAKA